MLVLDGKTESLGDKVEFKVESTIDPALPIQDRKEVLAFLQTVSKSANAAGALRASLTELTDESKSVRNVLKRSNLSTPELSEQARAIAKRLDDFSLQLNGDSNKQYFRVLSEPTISSRINGVLRGASNSTHGPTKTQREQFEIGQSQLEQASSELKSFVEDEVLPLREALDEAGIPWTKGRKIPEVSAGTKN